MRVQDGLVVAIGLAVVLACSAHAEAQELGPVIEAIEACTPNGWTSCAHWPRHQRRTRRRRRTTRRHARGRRSIGGRSTL